MPIKNPATAGFLIKFYGLGLSGYFLIRRGFFQVKP